MVGFNFQGLGETNHSFSVIIAIANQLVAPGVPKVRLGRGLVPKFRPIGVVLPEVTVGGGGKLSQVNQAKSPIMPCLPMADW
jgi:hypothetical protein